MIVFRKRSVLTLVSDTEMTLSLVGWEHIQTYTNRLDKKYHEGGWGVGETAREHRHSSSSMYFARGSTSTCFDISAV